MGQFTPARWSSLGGHGWGSLSGRRGSLDMTLDEIRVLLRLKNVPTQDCSEVNRVLEAHIEQVAVRIQELSALEQQLRSLREMCSEGRSAEQCGILCELSQPVSAAELAVP